MNCEYIDIKTEPHLIMPQMAWKELRDILTKYGVLNDEGIPHQNYLNSGQLVLEKKPVQRILIHRILIPMLQKVVVEYLNRGLSPFELSDLISGRITLNANQTSCLK